MIRTLHRISYPLLLFTFLIVIASGCTHRNDDSPGSGVPDDPSPEEAIYFPPADGSEWESISMSDLAWNTAAEQPLIDLLASSDTKAFLILHNGKIAMESYFNDFTRDSIWYWASAGKSLTAFTVGIAAEKNVLNINNPTSQYLGTGWTSAPANKEALITIRHQLSMTTGLKESAFDCVDPGCLEYESDAGSRWAYHNGPYTLLQKMVGEALNTNFSAFFNTYLRNKIGMDGAWITTNGHNQVYFSTARSMARFGLLNLSNGIWDGEILLSDTKFLEEMKNTSQEFNKAYGYLWWLNGRESYMLPGSRISFQGQLIPNAPQSLFAGLGKGDQKLYVIPSKSLVIVRMGEGSGQEAQGPTGFDNQLWEKINALIN